MRIPLTVACAGMALLIATASLAQTPPAKMPATAAAPAGQATGTLTAKGKTIKLTYAAAFVDQTDKKKRVVLLLTEQPVPSAGWKSHSDLMSYHSSTPIAGVVFRIDANEVDTAEYFVEKFPTSTSGVFQVVFDGAPGKTMAGKVKSSATAAKLSDPVVIDATFNTAVK